MRYFARVVHFRQFHSCKSSHVSLTAPLFSYLLQIPALHRRVTFLPPSPPLITLSFPPLLSPLPHHSLPLPRLGTMVCLRLSASRHVPARAIPCSSSRRTPQLSFSSHTTYIVRALASMCLICACLDSSPQARRSMEHHRTVGLPTLQQVRGAPDLEFPNYFSVTYIRRRRREGVHDVHSVYSFFGSAIGCALAGDQQQHLMAR